MAALVAHHLATPDQHLPDVDEALMFDYVFAGNGTFARGRRPGLEACVPISDLPVRGLRMVQPYVQWGFPKVPAMMLGLMFSISRSIASKAPREALFHLLFSRHWYHNGTPPPDHLHCSDGWHLVFPEQHATAENVKLRRQGHGSSEAAALIEVHSHHFERAFFSEQDDDDEGSMSFRLYGVIGTIFEQPTIRLRVGLFGYFFEYPASEFFEMPAGVREVYG